VEEGVGDDGGPRVGAPHLHELGHHLGPGVDFIKQFRPKFTDKKLANCQFLKKLFQMPFVR
jgi:hypothetical protein